MCVVRGIFVKDGQKMLSLRVMMSVTVTATVAETSGYNKSGKSNYIHSFPETRFKIKPNLFQFYTQFTSNSVIT